MIKIFLAATSLLFSMNVYGRTPLSKLRSAAATNTGVIVQVHAHDYYVSESILRENIIKQYKKLLDTDNFKGCVNRIVIDASSRGTETKVLNSTDSILISKNASVNEINSFVKENCFSEMLGSYVKAAKDNVGVSVRYENKLAEKNKPSLVEGLKKLAKISIDDLNLKECVVRLRLGEKFEPLNTFDTLGISSSASSQEMESYIRDNCFTDPLY